MYNKLFIFEKIKSLKNIITFYNISIFILVLSIFLVDRFTKNKIIELQLKNSNNIFVNNYINFDLTWNTGIGFGLFNLDAGIGYHLISFLIFSVIGIIMFFITKTKNVEKISYAIILGGAIGNFYDRIIYYAVPDFIDLHINNYHWFTFNIADIFVSLGIILLIFNELIYKKNETN